jgi:hypothetical protein
VHRVEVVQDRHRIGRTTLVTVAPSPDLGPGRIDRGHGARRIVLLMAIGDCETYAAYVGIHWIVMLTPAIPSGARVLAVSPRVA